MNTSWHYPTALRLATFVGLARRPTAVWDAWRVLLRPPRTEGRRRALSSSAKKKKREPLPPPKYHAPDKLPKKHMHKPVPKDIQPYLPAIQSYITETWLVKFPHGATVRKLQRDIAFRMKKGSPGKLPRAVLDTVVGALCRQGVVTVRNKGQTDRQLVVTRPELYHEE